jgi:hypothetical protein
VPSTANRSADGRDEWVTPTLTVLVTSVHVLDDTGVGVDRTICAGPSNDGTTCS